MRNRVSPTGFACTLLLPVAVGACGSDGSTDRDRSPAASSHSPVTSAGSAGPAELQDGPLEPGRYREVLSFECEEGDTIACPPNATPPPPMEYEVTVPDGWEAATDFRTLYPARAGGIDAGATTGPDGAGLVVGWTNFHVGLNSNPCARNHDGHLVPDIEVGPTVDDFARAVVDHPTLDVSKPVAVTLDGYRGRFCTLTGPADISGCDDWRPWDPGFYVQGPENHWDVWALDLDGTRLVVVAQYFPGTPRGVVTDLRAMVRSMEFRT